MAIGHDLSVNEPASNAPVFYREGDGDRHELDGLTICVVGYGHLGASMAGNLRDAGLTVTIGNIDDEYRAATRSDGFVVGDIDAMVAAADVVYVLIADEVIPGTFQRVDHAGAPRRCRRLLRLGLLPRLRPGRAGTGRRRPDVGTPDAR